MKALQYFSLLGAVTALLVGSATAQSQEFQGVARQFEIEDPLLIFPVEREAPDQLLEVFVGDEKVREFSIRLAAGEPDFWVFLETKDFDGETVTVRAEELDEGQVDWFFKIRQDTTYPGEEMVYKEELRPQIHFSSKRGWNNDPNGMMYYDGEFHLFYQHNPYGWDWGNMTWGHAVSKDLVHWEELGDALHPDEYGTMFSGSGVVDWNNTTGFQTGDDPPLICIYTNAGDTNPWSEGEPFTQGIAYSNDRGRTWTKYKGGEPVQGHLNDGNRDPKVIWWEETEEWVIVLYLVDSRMAFFRSEDLKRWELQSVLQSFHECPELFELPVDGNEDNTRWVLYGAAGDYFVGDFDGSHYTPDGEEIRYNYGNCFYASQTFSDVPEKDGRRIQIAWGQNDLPGMPFNQMMTFPVVLSLHDTDEGIRMFANPVEEIKKLYNKKHNWKNVSLSDTVEKAEGVEGELFDIDVEFEVGDANEIGLSILGEELVYNTALQELRFGEESAPLEPMDGVIRLRCIVDRVSLEIFANDGRIYMPMVFRPEGDDESLAVFARGGSATANSIQVRELNSIWN